MQDQFSQPNSSGPRGTWNDSQQPLANFPWDEYEIVPKNRKKEHGLFCRLFLGLGALLTFVRNLFFNLIFLLLILFLAGGYFMVNSFFEDGLSMASLEQERVLGLDPNAEVVYFDLQGPISEMPFSTARLDVLQRELESTVYGVKRHEIISLEKALHLIAQDKRIKKVIIDIDDMGPLSLSMVERLGKSINEVKAQGTEVITVGLHYSQAAYALAAYSNRIILDPLGDIDLKGISLSSLYFKDLLEKAHITPYIFRAGHFKSAVEPLMLNAMSYDVRREYQGLALKSWELYKKAVNIRSEIKNKALLPDAATYVQWMQKFEGNRAQLQLAEGLVDAVTPLSTFFKELSTEVAKDANNPDRPAVITYEDYLLLHQSKNAWKESQQLQIASTGSTGTTLTSGLKLSESLNTSSTGAGTSSSTPSQQRSASGQQISIIYGIGELVDRTETAQDFTPDNVIPLLTEAKFDKNVAAVVLYLNSPGGSVIASEQIRRAVAQFKESKKPLIVSMNGTAASGAYWIASEGDRIFATPTTLTGSIGVFGVTFGAHELFNRFGAYQDGVSTNELSQPAVAKEMPQSQQEILKLSVEKTYNDFISLVAKNRHLNPQHYQKYAEGQVFLAEDALQLGLIDATGGLDDALEAAAQAAGLNLSAATVMHMTPQSPNDLGMFESFFIQGALTHLSPEFAELWMTWKKQSRLLPHERERQHLLAISPLSEAQL